MFVPKKKFKELEKRVADLEIKSQPVEKMQEKRTLGNEEILGNKKVIEIRWGDSSRISNKGRRLPVPSSDSYN